MIKTLFRRPHWCTRIGDIWIEYIRHPMTHMFFGIHIHTGYWKGVWIGLGLWEFCIRKVCEED